MPGRQRKVLRAKPQGFVYTVFVAAGLTAAPGRDENPGRCIRSISPPAKEDDAVFSVMVRFPENIGLC